MTDYSSQKVAELQDLLKERGLSHTGKKAELVARLQASDAEQAKSSSTTTAAPEPDSTATKPSASETLAAAGGKGPPANPTAVPNQKAGEDPSADKGSVVIDHAAEKGNSTTTTTAQETPAAEPKADFSAHIPALTLEEEVEKRRKRAERFGAIPKPSESNKAATGNGDSGATTKDTKDPVAEAQRLLERQKRFGGAVAADGKHPGGVDSLNQALPERARKRGRGGAGADGAGGEGAADGEREGKRRDSRRRDGRGDQQQKQGKGNGKAGTGSAAGPAPVKKVNSEQSEKDRLAAEKRKARFGPKASG